MLTILADGWADWCWLLLIELLMSIRRDRLFLTQWMARETASTSSTPKIPDRIKITCSFPFSSFGGNVVSSEGSKVVVYVVVDVEVEVEEVVDDVDVVEDVDVVDDVDVVEDSVVETVDVSVVVSTDGTNGLVSSVVCGRIVVVSTVEDGVGSVVSVDEEGKKLVYSSSPWSSTG